MELITLNLVLTVMTEVLFGRITWWHFITLLVELTGILFYLIVFIIVSVSLL